jgi:hypothetical protein
VPGISLEIRFSSFPSVLHRGFSLLCSGEWANRIIICLWVPTTETERIDVCIETNEDLQEQLDQIADIANGGDEEEGRTRTDHGRSCVAVFGGWMMRREKEPHFASLGTLSSPVSLGIHLQESEVRLAILWSKNTFRRAFPRCVT